MRDHGHPHGALRLVVRIARSRFNDPIEPMALANMRGTTRGLFSQLRRETGDFVAPVIIHHPTAAVALSFQAALHADGVPLG
jgi:hypothetical protein